jgi:hypothetical protein
VFKHAPANLAQIFGLARGHGDKDFLVYEGERWSFAKTFQHVDALANRLVNVYGIKKGDRVAVAMRNYPEWAMSFAGILISGGVSVSMNSWWTEDETDYALRDSGAKVLICDDQRFENARKTCAELGIHVLLVRSELPSSAGHDRWETALELGTAAPAVEIVPDDDATILYTSGTTGRPKGAVSTHRAVISALMAFSARQAIEGVRATEKPEPDPFPPSFILIVPLFHVTGCVAVLMSCFVAGLKLVIMYKWDAGKALEIIEREKITNFVGVLGGWWWCAGPRCAGAQGGRQFQEGWTTAWLRHDRNQRIRPRQSRPRLRIASHQHGALCAADAGGDSRRQRIGTPGGQDGRNLDVRPDADSWLLEQARGHGGNHRGWLVALGRHRTYGRRGLFVHRGSCQRHDSARR